MKLKKRTKRNALSPALTFGCLGAALTFMVGLQQMSPSSIEWRNSREIAKTANVQADRQDRLGAIAADDIAELADEADRRYNAGCVMPMVPVEGEAYAYKVSVVGEGEQVMNPANGKPLSNSQLVCDDRGMTFVIVDGVTALPARTMDTALINQRFADYAGWNPAARRSDIFLSQEKD